MSKPTTIDAGQEYSADEAEQLFESMAREKLGMSGKDFLRRWDAGDFADEPDRPEVVEVAMLIPLVR